jgi:hypothetical protein
MSASSLEVADVFRAHGQRWRQAHAGHISLAQLKVMSAIETCRSAALGGHVLRCQSCDHQQIAYNSCRNRHCPKFQGSTAQRWLEARQADLLPVDYYHLVFTLPAPISDLAYCNKAVIYTILFKTAAKTLQTIAADPKHLGARPGLTLVLHTWGSAMTHHPHVVKALLYSLKLWIRPALVFWIWICLVSIAEFGTADSKKDEKEQLRKANAAIAFIGEIEPSDSEEFLLASQMFAVHDLSMTMAKRAAIPDQTIDGVDRNINRMTKLMRTFTTQMDALNKHRTKGQQKFTVQYVNVENGGQAIVGDVSKGGGDD